MCTCFGKTPVSYKCSCKNTVWFSGSTASINVNRTTGADTVCCAWSVSFSFFTSLLTLNWSKIRNEAANKLLTSIDTFEQEDTSDDDEIFAFECAPSTTTKVWASTNCWWFANIVWTAQVWLCYQAKTTASYTCKTINRLAAKASSSVAQHWLL